MPVHKLHETGIFMCSQMGDGSGQVGKPIQNFHERLKADIGIPHRAGSGVKKNALVLFHHQVVEAEEPLVERIKILNQKLELESKDFRIFHKATGHVQSVVVARMIRGEAVQILILLKDFLVPSVQFFRNAGAVRVVGIYDHAHALPPKALDALAVITAMNNMPVILLQKGFPNGIEKSVRKQVHVEINYFFRNSTHRLHHVGYFASG
jgi:hypothetical protein